MAALLPARGYEVRSTSARVTIGFAFDPQEGEHAFGSDRLVSFRRPAHTLALVPAGCEVRSASRDGGEYLVLSVAERTARDALGEAVRRRTERCATRETLGIAETVRRMLLGGGVGRRALADGVGGLLASLSAPGYRRGPVLGRSRLARLDRLVDASLDRDAGPLRVTALAAALDLSADQLSRACVATLGCGARAYVERRRLARARSLMTSSEARLLEVALDGGYVDQAHLGRVFRRVLGVTPAAWRNGLADE